MSSVVGRGADYECKFLLWSYVKQEGDDNRLLKPAFDLFEEDLARLENGYDADGTPFIVIDGHVWTATLIFGKADTEVLTVSWGLASYNGVEHMCGKCHAARSHHPFTDLRLDADCFHPPLSNTDFKARLTVTHHPFQESRYFGKYMVRFDIMHIYDHKGCTGIIHASIILKPIQDEPRLGATQPLRLKRVNELKNLFYSRHVVTSRMTDLRQNNIVYGGATPGASPWGHPF